MLLAAKAAPAHNHRARHNFQRARDAILKAARGALGEANEPGNRSISGAAVLT
jgi:hypothetical protein